MSINKNRNIFGSSTCKQRGDQISGRNPANTKVFSIPGELKLSSHAWCGEKITAYNIKNCYTTCSNKRFERFSIAYQSGNLRQMRNFQRFPSIFDKMLCIYSFHFRTG